MKKWTSRLLSFLLCLTLFTGLCTFASAEGRIVELPIAETDIPSPDSKYYLSDTEYEDPSMHIWMEEGRAYDTDYIVIHVKLATAAQFRTAMESPDGRDTAFGDRIARHAGAVLAMNGSYFRYHRQQQGHYEVRQGRTILANVDSIHEDPFDVLIVDDKGDFTIVQNATKASVEATGKTMVNVFTFGPALVIDGVALTNIQDYSIAAQNPNQRLCIGQTGELEYMIIATAGPENPGSTGMTLDQLAELMVTLGPVTSGYNMDGGSSSTIIFNNKKINEFGLEGRKRVVSDMICFVSAWRE